jgi:hypothetical protein
LFGCGKDKPVVGNTTTPIVTTGTVEPAQAVVPEALKTAAYEYKGLASNKMLTYSAQFSPEMGPEDGTETILIQESSGGTVKYNVERTGSLTLLGTDTLELSDKGVSLIASSQGVLDTPSIELPADIAVGKEWKGTTTMSSGSRKFESNSTFKVLREEKVTVAAGTFDCLVIESHMTAKVSGSSNPAENGTAKTDLLAYYAKGVGMVKLSAKGVKTNGDKQDLKIELKKIG